MYTYSDPKLQAVVSELHNTINSTNSIITAMRQTKELGKRTSDKCTGLTQSQRDAIAKNQGMHIYGSSHPLYKG